MICDERSLLVIAAPSLYCYVSLCSRSRWKPQKLRRKRQEVLRSRSQQKFGKRPHNRSLNSDLEAIWIRGTFFADFSAFPAKKGRKPMKYKLK